MLEVSAGVFVSTSLNKGARDRVWEVLSEWHSKLRNGSLILITGNREGVKLKTLGEPIKQIVDIDGILVTLSNA